MDGCAKNSENTWHFEAVDLLITDPNESEREGKT
jgi:hypothetical protein